MEIKKKSKRINDFKHMKLKKYLYFEFFLSDGNKAILSLFISQWSTALHFSVTLFFVEIYAAECHSTGNHAHRGI